MSGNWLAERELIDVGHVEFSPGLSKYASNGKVRKADRGIGKSESKAILQHIGVFVPVGSGKYTFFSYPLSCIPRCDGRRH